MGNFNNGPLLWSSLLNIVGEHWLPMVAGGAIRDWEIREPAKDVDIFVPAMDDEDFISIINSLPAGLCEGEIIYVSSAYFTGTEEWSAFCANNPGKYGKDAAAPDLVGVWEGEITGVPVNIIGRECLTKSDLFSTQAEALLNTFDFDTCQAAYSNNSWCIFPGFKQACRSRTASLLHNRSYDQSLERFERFAKRQPVNWMLLDSFKQGASKW